MTNDSVLAEIARLEGKLQDLRLSREQAVKSFSLEMIEQLSESIRDCEIEIMVLQKDLPFMLRTQAP